MKKRLLASLLSLVMVLTMLPTAALEMDGNEDSTDSVIYTLSTTESENDTVTIGGTGEITMWMVEGMYGALATRVGDMDYATRGQIKYVIIESGITGFGKGLSSIDGFFHYAEEIIIRGTEGTFHFWDYSCQGSDPLIVKSDRPISMGQSAFEERKLTAFPMNKIVSVGGSAFRNATLPIDDATLEFTLGENATMGSNAFNGAKNKNGGTFTSVKITATGDLTLGSEVNTTSNVFDSTVTSITVDLQDNAALTWGGGIVVEQSYQVPLQSITINGSGTVSFANNAFNSGSSRKYLLETVTTGDDVTCTSIGINAFEGCTSLTSFPFDKVYGTIGKEAFRNCSGLTGSVDLSNVTSIGEYAFENVTGVDDWSFPDAENLDKLGLAMCF